MLSLAGIYRETRETKRKGFVHIGKLVGEESLNHMTCETERKVSA